MKPEWPIDARRAAHEAESSLTKDERAIVAKHLNAAAFADLRGQLDKVITHATRLRASHDRLLAAANGAALLLCSFANDPHINEGLNDLQAAIAAAEEREP